MYTCTRTTYIIWHMDLYAYNIHECDIRMYTCTHTTYLIWHTYTHDIWVCMHTTYTSKTYICIPPKDAEIALWSATNRWYVVECFSQKRNQSNNKNRWYNILVTFIFKFNCGQYKTKTWLLSNLSVIVDSLPGNTKNREATRSWLIRVRLFHPWAACTHTTYLIWHTYTHDIWICMHMTYTSRTYICIHVHIPRVSNMTYLYT